MTQHIDWRSKADYAYVEQLSASELAWEFLRRNPEYRKDYSVAVKRTRIMLLQPRIARWGLRFAADPTLSARDADVVWQIALDPSTLILTTVPRSLTHGDGRFRFQGGRSAREGQYGTIVAKRQNRTALLLPGRNGPCLAAVIPLDTNLCTRGRLALMLFDAARHDSASRTMPLSPIQRRRIAQMLRALDGRLSGMAAHQIALHLYGSYMIPAREWKSHADRSRVRRLIADAHKLSQGGYRALLHLV